MKLNFKKMLQRTREEYFSWTKELSCPYFKELVRITRSGWSHLMAERRTRDQKYWRGKYFRYIPIIITKTTTLQKETVCHTKSGIVRFWSFISIEKGNTLEVVVRQIGKQPKHFYSFVYKGMSPIVKNEKSYK